MKTLKVQGVSASTPCVKMLAEGNPKTAPHNAKSRI